MSVKYKDSDKLYEKEHYFIVKKIPRRQEHPYAWQKYMKLIVQKTKYNECGEHHHGVKWVENLQEGKDFIDRELEKGR
jgi:hypothetical protein